MGNSLQGDAAEMMAGDRPMADTHGPVPDPARNRLTRRAVLAAGLGLAASACSTYLPSGTTTPATLSRSVILQQINATRAAYGREPLTYNPLLEDAARTHARLMAEKGILSHTLGGTLRERVTAAGYHGAVAENLAGGQHTLERAIEDWLNSAGHRRTLLSPNFTEFGLAAATSDKGQKFYWAMIFGGSLAAWLNP